jgi:hypothetical protein
MVLSSRMASSTSVFTRRMLPRFWRMLGDSVLERARDGDGSRERGRGEVRLLKVLERWMGPGD